MEVPVDRAAVVGIDERPVGQLVALVGVGNARGGELQHQLSERGTLARGRHALDERLEVVQERAAGVQRTAELHDRLLPVPILIDPVGVALGLP